MDKIYNIKYVDAQYTYAKEIGDTRLPIQEAYGFVERNADDVVVIFIKKKGSNNLETIKNKENIVKGLVIPKTALLPTASSPSSDKLKEIEKESRIVLTWRDVRYVANMPVYDSAVMSTEAFLVVVRNDHIVLKKPKTIRSYPLPAVSHPTGEAPAYLLVPISSIIDIKAVDKPS